MSGMVGGAAPPQDAGPDVQDICNLVRPAVEEKAGRVFDEYTAVKVSTQCVAGINYFVKISVGGGEYIHARIFKPLPGQGEPQLHSIQHGKTVDDSVAYF